QTMRYWDPPRFSDVSPGSTFYTYIQWAACRGIIGGYADGTFRPGNSTTRGQVSKIVVLAAGWEIDTGGGPHFTDVPPGSAFYPYIETAYNRHIIAGYGDGTFRPGNNVTRGQLCKIMVLAQEWPVNSNGGPHFSDVAPGSTFYDYIETAFNKSIIG